jgi:hypothetical protein
MTDRNEIEREMKEKLDKGESAYEKLKAKLDEAGDDASDEAREAVRSAGEMLDKGKAKMKQLAEASDDEFDKLWAETKAEWHELNHGMSDGWSKFTHSVRDFFS